jgi:hypothetical protein
MPSLAPRMKTAERPGERSIETTQSVPAWDCGTTNLAKVIHNFRHRAQDRLRASECPQDVSGSLSRSEPVWRFRLSIEDLANRGRQVRAAKRLLDQFDAGIEAALMNDGVS